MGNVFKPKINEKKTENLSQKKQVEKLHQWAKTLEAKKEEIRK